MLFKKKTKPICKNCGLYDPNKGICKVIILYEGERINLPVDPNDPCFYENEFVDKDNNKFKPEVQQVRMWVEDEKGVPTDKNGIVKIEAPVDFFNDTKY